MHQGNELHRWHRCFDCDKKNHTIERHIKPGPVPGKPQKSSRYGERNAAALFTEADILRMRQMAADGIMQKDIAKVFGTAPNYVSKIVNRHAWKHI